MRWPATGSKGLPPFLMTASASVSGRRTNRPSPKRPVNMLPFTNAARFPNIGRSVIAGSAGTIALNFSFAASLGLGIFMPVSVTAVMLPRGEGRCRPRDRFEAELCERARLAGVVAGREDPGAGDRGARAVRAAVRGGGEAGGR